MILNFTKMHGAGNDFVVLDATQTAFDLSTAQLQRLADRRLGVGADQILVVEAASSPAFDFRYRIFNGATGEEVEHCGNGARCFVRYVHERGLSQKSVLRVQTVNRTLVLQAQPDGAVRVDMGAPVLTPESVAFHTEGLRARRLGNGEVWPLQLEGAHVELSVASMGNPHAMVVVPDVETAPVMAWGTALQQHPRFERSVNVGFMQVLARGHIGLRVFERGAGETLSCGTGACAAVVLGVQQGLLDSPVEVNTRGGRLMIAWSGPGTAVHMIGPAVTVFQGAIEL
jgi:diaminopimelate epimerase